MTRGATPLSALTTSRATRPSAASRAIGPVIDPVTGPGYGSA